MTQFDPTNDDLEDDDLDATDDLSNVRKQLRQSQRNNKALAAQVEEASSIRKENAVLKAGLPDTPQVKFFIDHYLGDPTPEAIKQAAAEFGFIPQVDQQTQDEVDEFEGQSQAFTGSTDSIAPGDREAILKEFAEVVSRGGNGEAVLRKHGHRVGSDDR